MTCDRCGGPLDPDVTHIQHDPECWWSGQCWCPEVCAACCTDPTCPLRTETTP